MKKLALLLCLASCGVVTVPTTDDAQPADAAHADARVDAVPPPDASYRCCYNVCIDPNTGLENASCNIDPDWWPEFCTGGWQSAPCTCPAPGGVR